MSPRIWKVFPISMCFSKCHFPEKNLDPGNLWKVFPIGCFLFAGGVGRYNAIEMNVKIEWDKNEAGLNDRIEAK